MNKYQNEINILLNEVIEICNTHQIPWFMSGRSAIRYYLDKAFDGDFLDAEITIPIDRVFCLLQACENIENRFVECYINNPNFPGVYLKYIDINTTLINYNEGLACNVRGFYIKINLLRSVPTDEKIAKRALKYEDLIEDTAKTYVELTGRTTFIERMWFGIKKQLGYKYHQKVFRYLVDAYSSADNSKKVVRTVDGTMHYFESNRFVNTVDLCVNNSIIKIPEKATEFFEECFGKEWKRYAFTPVGEGKKGDIIYDGINYLLSVTVPYPFFVDELKKHKINRKFLKARQKNLECSYRDSEALKPVNDAWDLANRAGDLWNVFDYYKDKKERITKLYDFGEFFSLENELKYYDDMVQKYVDMNMGFMYDKDLWEIYLYIKKFRASAEEADRIRRLAEEDEKLKIQLRDMEKQLNESFGLYC